MSKGTIPFGMVWRRNLNTLLTISLILFFAGCKRKRAGNLPQGPLKEELASENPVIEGDISKNQDLASDEVNSEILYPAKQVRVPEELPACETDSLTYLYYIQKLNLFAFCKNGQWMPIDIEGPKGGKGDVGEKGENGIDGSQGLDGKNFAEIFYEIWRQSIKSLPLIVHFYETTTAPIYKGRIIAGSGVLIGSDLVATTHAASDPLARYQPSTLLAHGTLEGCSELDCVESHYLDYQYTGIYFPEDANGSTNFLSKQTPDGTSTKVDRTIGSARNLAVLKIDSESPLPSLALSNRKANPLITEAESLSLFENVMLIEFSKDLDFAHYSLGRIANLLERRKVSGLEVDLDTRLIYHTAVAIAHLGGGALIDATGEIVGFALPGESGTSLAISAEYLAPEFLNQLSFVDIVALAP
jgi:hypothetical protein